MTSHLLKRTETYLCVYFGEQMSRYSASSSVDREDLSDARRFNEIVLVVGVIFSFSTVQR